MTGGVAGAPWDAALPPGLLLATAVLLPGAVAILWPLARLRGVMVRVAPWAAAPALALSLLPGVEGTGVEFAPVATGMGLALDGTGLPFLRLTALLWTVGGAFAARYHARDPHRARFFGFFALTLLGNLGLTVAADALTFYLFFAVMTFSAYGLVVHGRTGEALRAGKVYIVLALVGEVLLLAALMTLGSRAGALGVPSLAFGAELGGLWSDMEEGVGGGRILVAALLVAGFGVKAGLAPLHLWLPLAHPVAPTAASALLSGVMIKAGLLGWLRFLPLHLPVPEVGGALVVLGIATALYGVAMGLPQGDAKTVLAYSSVSQMGNMAVGVGVLLLAPQAAPLALAAVVLHAVHHGVAKGALFLGVGVGDRAPYLRRALLAASLVPALALAGAPLTSGVLAKGLLKDALSEVGGGWYGTLNPLLLVASGGTALLLARFGVTWWSRMEETAEAEKGGGGRQGGPLDSVSLAPWGLLLPWGLLVALGALAPLWLPALALPGVEVPIPGAGDGLLTALLPLVSAVILSLLVLRRPGRLRGLRVPAGDLLLPLETLARLLGNRLRPLVRRPPGWETVETGRVGPWVLRILTRGAEGDLRLIQGASLGFFLLGLALVVAWAAGWADGP